MSLPRRTRRPELLRIRTHPNDEALRPRVAECSTHDAALRAIDTACTFIAASLPAVSALPLAALASFLLAAIVGFMRFRLLTRIRTRVRAVAILALVVSVRLILLFFVTRNINPASAVVAAAAAAPLVVAKGAASPLLALAALAIVACDGGGDTQIRHTPLMNIARHARQAYNHVHTRMNREVHLLDTDTNSTSSAVDDEVKAEKPASWDKPGTDTVQEGDIAKMPAPALIDSTENASENKTQRKISSNKTAVTHDVLQGNNESGHLTRHTLAVVNEKGEQSLSTVQRERVENIVQQSDVSDGKDGAEDNEGESRIGLHSVSVALMVAAALLSDAACGMTRALVVDIGDCAVVVMAVSAISFVLMLPFAVIDRTGTIGVLFANDVTVGIENAMTWTAVLGLGMFFFPVYINRAAELTKANSLALCSSPRVSCPTGASGGRDAILRVTISRLQTTSQISLPLALITCLTAIVFHTLRTQFFGKVVNVSGLTVLGGCVVVAACWLQRKGADVGGALMKRIFGYVRSGVVNTIHGVRLFISQSQSNKASWQVLNFFLFQAGMVLLESLYALTTRTTGLILVSADNIFCCVGLALGMYTIRRTSRRIAGDKVRRLESVAGFANGVLLVYVAVLVVLEALERQLDQGKVEYAHTFTVCVVGSLGNIAGLVFFPPESRRENHNVQGIYLHIWGNTLAFVGVAVCTVLGERSPESLWIGVAGALVVAAVIVVTAVPLLVASAKVLTEQNTRILHDVTSALKNVPGIRDVEPVRVWTIAGEETVAAVRIFATGATEPHIRTVREQIAMAGYKRAKVIVEVMPVEMHRRTRSSTRIQVGSAHRRSHSCSRVDMLALEEA